MAYTAAIKVLSADDDPMLYSLLSSATGGNTHVIILASSHMASLFFHPQASNHIPDSKVHGANVGPTWGRQDPGGPHVGPMNFAIWDVLSMLPHVAGW